MQITVNDLATELNTDARTTRKFLRSITPKDEQPGKGARWSIEKRSVRGLKKQFTDFQAAAEARAAARTESHDKAAEEIAEENEEATANA